MELSYDIATEGARFDSLKQKVKTVFDKIKAVYNKIIMTIQNFISKIARKIAKVGTFKINRNYYSEIIKIIHKVQAMDVSYSTKIKAYSSAATFDEEKVTEIYTEITDKLQDLADLTSNAKAIKSPISGPTIEIITSHYEKMKTSFTLMQRKCATDVQLIPQIYQSIMTELNKSGTDASKEFIKGKSYSEFINSILTVTSRNAKVNFTRASLLIELSNMIERNIIRDESTYDDFHDYKKSRYKNVKKESSYTNKQIPVNYPRIADKSMENFIIFCDEYQIAEESLYKAKNMYKKESEYINKNKENIDKMPETTKEEIDNKLHAIKVQRGDIKDLIDRISSEKVNLADRLISFAAKVVKTNLNTAAILTGASLFLDDLNFDTSIYHVWKKFAIILGSNMAGDLLSKATIKNKEQFIRIAINELKARDNALSKKQTKLNKKLNTL